MTNTTYNADDLLPGTELEISGDALECEGCNNPITFRAKPGVFLGRDFLNGRKIDWFAFNEPILCRCGRIIKDIHIFREEDDAQSPLGPERNP